jgi:hypothetical protein
MRPLSIVGIVVMALGAFLVFRGATYSSREDVVRIGDFKVTAEERRPVPAWVGGVVIVVGLGLVLAGRGARR